MENREQTEQPKVRKIRSDKGKTRGPYKPRTAAAEPTEQVSTNPAPTQEAASE